MRDRRLLFYYWGHSTGRDDPEDDTSNKQWTANHRTCRRLMWSQCPQGWCPHMHEELEWDLGEKNIASCLSHSLSVLGFPDRLTRSWLWRQIRPHGVSLCTILTPPACTFLRSRPHHLSALHHCPAHSQLCAC